LGHCKALSSHFANVALFSSKQFFFAIVKSHSFLKAFFNGLK
jgi:hypothetical protein